jgi:hypothetical protein
VILLPAWGNRIKFLLRGGRCCRLDYIARAPDCGEKQRGNSMRVLIILATLITLAACDIPFVPLI